MNSTHSTGARISLAPLYWLALGTFAVGTESFMIAGLLPAWRQTCTPASATGQLVTVFALAYAFSSPVLTALTGRFNRRNADDPGHVRLRARQPGLRGRAQNYWELMAARVLLAAAAGLYFPAPTRWPALSPARSGAAQHWLSSTAASRSRWRSACRLAR